jgi:septation ring formation regulator EzrA
MIKGVIAFVILAVIAGALGYRWYEQEIELRHRQEEQIVELNQQVKKIQGENETLKAQLAKVQDEEGRLAAANELLTKAIEQSKLTGKIAEKPPNLPYPPK